MITKVEITQAVKFANWTLPSLCWGRLEGGEVDLCPAAYILLARHGEGLRVTVDGLLFPTSAYLLRANDVLRDLADWCDKAGLLTRHYVEDTVVDLFVDQQQKVFARMPKT